MNHSYKKKISISWNPVLNCKNGLLVKYTTTSEYTAWMLLLKTTIDAFPQISMKIFRNEW